MTGIDEEAFTTRFRSDTAFAASIVSAPNLAAARVAAASYGYLIDAVALAMVLADHAVSCRPVDVFERPPVMRHTSMRDFGDF
jgi:hypothetical protein